MVEKRKSAGTRTDFPLESKFKKTAGDHIELEERSLPAVLSRKRKFIKAQPTPLTAH